MKPSVVLSSGLAVLSLLGFAPPADALGAGVCTISGIINFSPSPQTFYAVIFAAAIAGLTFAERRRNRLFRGVQRPLSSHRCRAWPLFSQLGTSSFQLDAVVEVCDDPAVLPGTPFSLRLKHPARRNDYLFSKVRAAVERGHALFVDVEDYVTARKARLCANGWTVVLDVAHSAGWPTCVLETCVH